MRQEVQTAKPRPAVSAAGVDDRELIFAEPSIEAFHDVYAQLVRRGVQGIGLRPFNQFAADLLSAIAPASHGPRFVAPGADAADGLPSQVERVAGDAAVDVTFVCAQDAAELSALLMAYLDLAGGSVVAPITSAFFKSRPLFLISIPKSGTHLLYELARAFGYAPGIVCPADPLPGSWYCVEYSNSHTSARNFFVDTVRRSHFGNRHHPFLRSPAIFIYRNPLDILVSEASYYHRDGKTAFYGYLSEAPFEERLLKLIEDPWLLGSIRDRVGEFLPWLELPNVASVSFEELVGSAGGGSNEVQAALIWSLQLKLHVPGRPSDLGRHLFNPNSATFREGQIGAYRKQLTAEAFHKFFSLPQDFMKVLGYPITTLGDVVSTPRRAEEFRRRPLKVSEATFDFPVAVEYGYRGYNLVLSQGTYYGLAQDVGPVDLSAADVAGYIERGECVRGRSLEEVRGGIDRLQMTRAVSQHLEDARVATDQAREREDATPRLVEEAYFGYNVVAYRGRGYALAQELGPLDLTTTALGPLEASEQCIVRSSPEEAKRAVLEARLRASERALAGLRDASAAVRQELDSKSAELASVQTELSRALEALNHRDRGMHEAETRHADRVTQLETDLAGALGTLDRREREMREAHAGQADRVKQLEAELSRAIEILEQQKAAVRDAQATHAARVTQLETDLAGTREAHAGQAARVKQLEADLSRAIETWERRDAEARETQTAHAARLRELEKELSVTQETARGLSLLLGEREGRTAWLSTQLDAAREEVAAARHAQAAAEEQERRWRSEQEATQASAVGRMAAENEELRRWIDRLQEELVDAKARRGLFGRR